MYDEQHFTRDAATATFNDDADGITVDDGDVSIDWDEVATVTVDNPPHADAFESKEFYKLPATVAKPIPQPYQFGEDTVWLKKPREELRNAAWSLDNAPVTLDHPETGMVKNVDDVHGFWQNTRYIDSLDDLDADMHVPVGDEEAKEHIEDNSDVSVGFYNRIARTDDYDGIVGGEDADGVEVEGYQTNMLFDHAAAVGVGRCPSSAGCGIDSPNHGHIDAFKRGSRTTHISDDVDGQEDSASMDATTDQPSGIKMADGQWFAVGPSEHTKDSTDHPGDHMYEVGSCADVEDAWGLRGAGEDLTISQETLENRIVRAAEAQDCSDIPSTMEEEMDTASDAGDCNCSDSTTMDIDFDDLSAEAAIAKVSSQHDGVEEYLDDLRSAQDAAEAAEDAAEELEIDDVESLADAVGVLTDEKEELEEKLDDLEDELAEAQRPAMEEDAEAIAKRTDRFGEDAEAVIENLDEDPATVSEKRELVEDLTEGYDEKTANADTDGGSTDAEPSGKYAKTPW